MSSTVIQVENLGKQYRLGQVGTGTLSHDLNRWWHTIRGREDPYLKLGDVNDRSKKGSSDLVWALKDINFQVKQGEVLGIVGKNGAGKSTLLKVLSRVTGPTTGSIKVKGRIASLLEVGTGFHPELTGRENIFLNGAILGMSKAEIKSKLDEIIDFSGVARYIDTPVKRYSSGMYVRLAFAVAAHLEPEILIVDEVLAVGDAEFQKKCLGKMKDVSGQGRTVLFVSHNMSSLRQLCTSGLLMANGSLTYSGDIDSTITKYLSGNSGLLQNTYNKPWEKHKDFQLTSAAMVDENNNVRNEFSINEDVFFRVSINCSNSIPNVYGYVVIKNNQDEVLVESDTFDYLPNILSNVEKGENNYLIKLSRNALTVGDYFIYVNFASQFAHNFSVDSPGNILTFKIADYETKRGMNRKAYTGQLLKWNKI